jgi:hypothetical protein
MLELSWLTEQRSRMQRGLDSARREVDALRRALQGLHDQPLTPEYKEERAAELREPVLAAVRALVADSNQMLAVVREQRTVLRNSDFSTAACESINTLIHQQWTLATGARESPSQKLTAARAQIALA